VMAESRPERGLRPTVEGDQNGWRSGGGLSGFLELQAVIAVTFPMDVSSDRSARITGVRSAIFWFQSGVPHAVRIEIALDNWPARYRHRLLARSRK
jgi:hypothetical protein